MFVHLLYQLSIRSTPTMWLLNKRPLTDTLYWVLGIELIMLSSQILAFLFGPLVDRSHTLSGKKGHAVHSPVRLLVDSWSYRYKGDQRWANRGGHCSGDPIGPRWWVKFLKIHYLCRKPVGREPKFEWIYKGQMKSWGDTFCGHEYAHVKDPVPQTHRNGSFLGSGEVAKPSPALCEDADSLCRNCRPELPLSGHLHLHLCTSAETTPTRTPRRSMSAS